jgi:predicted NACHT family NTPase
MDMNEGDGQDKELEKLRRTEKHLETQRAILGDEAVDISLTLIRQQITELETIRGVETSGGDDIEVGDIKEGRGIAIGRGAQAHILNIYMHAPGRPMVDEAGFSEALDSYLEWVEKYYGRLNLRGVERREQQVLSLGLDEVYVSLEAELSPDRREMRAKSGGRTLQKEVELGEERPTVDMSQLLSLGPRLVITGGPGSGKTTYLQIIASSLARALHRGDTQAVQRHLGLEGELPLPIFIPLSEYNRYRREIGPAGDPRLGTLLHFISHYLIREQAAIGLPEDFFERLLVEGQACTLLLDGLDEVADERERWLVSRAVEKLSHNRGIGAMLVTSRTRAYQDRAVLPEEFRACAVRPMTPEQVDGLAARWCAAVFDETQARRETVHLQKAIHDMETLRQARNESRLVDSPLLVTIVAIVHYNERRLPEQRAELYERCVDVLLAEKHKEVTPALFELVDRGGTLPEKRGLLAFLAYQMMVAGEEGGRTVSEDQIQDWLRPRFVRLRGEEEAGRELSLFIQAMRERGSLLDERGGRYSFLHLTFQEYLCAYYLAETVREVDKIVAFLAQEGRLAQAWWRETILLVAGYLGLKSEETALGLIRRLADLGTVDAQALACRPIASAGTRSPWPNIVVLWRPAATGSGASGLQPVGTGNNKIR